MQPSPSYSQLLLKFEGIKGAVGPGVWTYYWDLADIATAGYGHALTDALGQIKRDHPYAASRAAAALHALFGAPTITTAQALELKARDMAVFAGYVAPLIHWPTPQHQFDALLDFAYNAGSGNLKSSTLLSLHNSGKAQLGSMDLHQLRDGSRNKAHIMSIGQAFAAWSNSDGQWSLGVFRRRMVEFLMYAGHDYADAYSTAFSVSA